MHHIVARDRAAIISSAFGMSAASCVSRAAVAVAPRAPPRASSSRRPTTRRVRAPPPRRDASASATESTAAESTTAAEEAPVARSLEFMVEMACGKCVAKVEHALAHVPGIDAVAATLSTNSVRVVTATASTDAIVAAIERAGFNCRLIGQGDVGAFGEELARRLGTNLRTLRQSLAAVAEFKGSAYGHGSIAGVVRFVAADERNTLIEGGLRGLKPFATYAMTVRAYGDTTRGLETVGEVYDAADDDGDDSSENARRAAGDMGTLVADANGEVTIVSRVVDARLKAWDIIGRSLAVVEQGGGGGGEDGTSTGAAAVLARSAGVGENLKRVCDCDGTVIWESSPDDFTPVVVKKKLVTAVVEKKSA